MRKRATESKIKKRERGSQRHRPTQWKAFAPTPTGNLRNARYLSPKFTHSHAIARSDPPWHGGFSTFYSIITCECRKPQPCECREPQLTPQPDSPLTCTLFKDCPRIQTSTVSPLSQTQPACITWRLASCWRKTWDTWGSFKGRSWVGGTEWVLSRGITRVWLNSRADLKNIICLLTFTSVFFSFLDLCYIFFKHMPTLINI